MGPWLSFCSGPMAIFLFRPPCPTFLFTPTLPKRRMILNCCMLGGAILNFAQTLYLRNWDLIICVAHTRPKSMCTSEVPAEEATIQKFLIIFQGSNNEHLWAPACCPVRSPLICPCTLNVFYYLRCSINTSFKMSESVPCIH